jgi:hypothetical protein
MATTEKNAINVLLNDGFFFMGVRVKVLIVDIAIHLYLRLSGVYVLIP